MLFVCVGGVNWIIGYISSYDDFIGWLDMRLNRIACRAGEGRGGAT